MYISLRNKPEVEEPSSRSRLARVSSPVILLGLVSLFTDISSEMVAAILAIFATAELGLSVFAYGFVDGVYQGVSALVRLLGGYSADRAGRPKWIAAIGYGVSTLSRIALVAAQGLAAVTAIVTADRLGKGLRTAPRDALIAASSDPAVLGRSFGVHRALDTIGAAAGPILAFALLNFIVPGSYDSVFVVSFGLGVIGLSILVFLVPNLRTRAHGARVSARHVLREITGPRLRRPLAAAALLGVFTISDGFLYLTMQQRDQYAAALFPLLYVGTNIAYLALAVPFGRLADRVGRARVLVGGHVALMAAYVVAALPTGGLSLTLLTLLLLGTFYAATDGVLSALVSRIMPQATRGSGIAAAQTVVAVARFISAVGFGALWLQVGRAPALLIAAGLLMVAIPAAAVLLRPVEQARAVAE